jgi:hypothetical protein
VITRVFATAINLLLVASVGCSRHEQPTKEKCAVLLHSHQASKEEMQRFIASANKYLVTVPPDEEMLPSNEGLGLCTGALMRKAASAE